MSVEYLIFMRLFQLTLGSLIGLICIYFGYKLFSQIPVNVTNDGHFKMPKIGEAKLKVAPGIFFAILGTGIVYFSIDRTINIKSAPLESASTNAQPTAVPASHPESAASNTPPIPPRIVQPPPPLPPRIEYSQQPRGVEYYNCSRGSPCGNK